MNPCPTFFAPAAWDALNALADDVRPLGAELFVFGSFAPGRQRKTSDADIGVHWTGAPSIKVFANIVDRIEALPTMRTFDTVDFSIVDPEFAAIALRATIALGQHSHPQEVRNG